MNHRIEKTASRAQIEGARVGIVSMYDVENNAVRVLAATLRAAGHHVTEIYFKDWISNYIAPPTDEELENLKKVILRADLNLVCVSIRASAYYNAARILTEYLQQELETAVLWGGMHPTLVPEQCIETADMVLKGEGELALTDLSDRLAEGRELDGTPVSYTHLTLPTNREV